MSIKIIYVEIALKLVFPNSNLRMLAILKKYLLNSIIIVIDILALISIFYLAVYFRIGITSSSVPIFNKLLLSDFSFVIFIIFALLYNEKIYQLRYDFWQETKKIFRSLVLAYFIVLAMLALSKLSAEYSRLFIAIYFLLALVLMPIVKRYTKKIVYRLDFFKKRVLIVGHESAVETFKDEFKKNWYLGMVFSKEVYDTVIISQKDMSVEEVNTEIETYLSKTSSVHVVPHVTSINFASSNIMEYSNIRYNTIQIENKLLIQGNIVIKKAFDFFFITLISPLFLFLHILIAFLIKIDSKGAIFFKQHRLGKNDNDFICYKYRTMYENSDDLLKEYLKNNPQEVEYYKKYHKYQDDPRITKIGKFLRSTSLDELAQIINIYKNEMSLVGPRPYMLNESDKLGKKQHVILMVQPGITGLWQVSGRNNLTFAERNSLEVWYIKNWSLWNDFVILMKTVKVVLLKVGAR